MKYIIQERAFSVKNKTKFKVCRVYLMYGNSSGSVEHQRHKSKIMPIDTLCTDPLNFFTIYSNFWGDGFIFFTCII